MKMKVLMVLNKPNREYPIMETIQREIQLINPSTEVEIKEMCTPSFNEFVLKYRPNVILTFPFTGVGLSTWYYFFKLLFKCRIFSFRAEGVVDCSSDFIIQTMTGFDTYGKRLVDYEIFWGKRMAEVIGGKLLKQGKLSSDIRIKYLGYPRLESYFLTNDKAVVSDLPERISMKIKDYRKEDILFFITGFHLSNYTRQNLFDAKDLDAENKIEKLLDEVEMAKKFRQEWVQNILRVAEENKQVLFIVKKHPIEKREDYKTFEERENILYIYEDVDIKAIMCFVGIFFHYGSTSLVDSYLSHVPSVYVYSEKNKEWYSDLGLPSTLRAKVSDIPDAVRQYRQGEIKFSMTPEIRSILKEVFNIEEGKPYHPSREIAEIIMNDEPAQRIPLTDRYLWKAFASVFFQLSVRFTGKMIKKLFRIPPEVDLLQMLNKKLRG